MANAHSSSSESGGSAWSVINVILAGAFALVTLFLGGTLVWSGAAASRAKRAPKVEAPKAAEAAPSPAAAAAPTAPIGGVAAAPAPAVASGPAQELELTPDAVNPMAFGTKSFTVKAGQPVKLTFANKAALPLPHNVVVGKAGSKDALFAASMKIMTAPDGMAKGYIPDAAACPEMLAHTGLVQPGQSETITFVCSTPGEYPYVCMFPGHTMMMNGTIKAE